MSKAKTSWLSGKRLIIKTTAIVVITVLVVFFFLFLVQGKFITRGVFKEQKTAAVQQAFLVAELFDARIRESRALLDFYALNPDTTEQYLELIISRNPLYANVFIVDQTSGVITHASDPSLIGIVVAGIPVFANNLALGALSFTDPYPIKLSEQHEEGSPIAVRLAGPPGAGRYLVGMIGADEMNDVFFEEIKVAQQGYPFIVDRTGKIIAHPNHDLHGVDLSEYDFIQQMTNDTVTEGFVSYLWSKGNDERLIYKKYLAFQRMKGIEWIVGVSIYEEDLLAVARTISFLSYMLGFAALIVVSLVMSIFLHRGLIARFLIIRNAVAEAATGNLTARIELSGNDEVTDMARGLNELFNSIRDSVSGISRGVGSLNEATESLSINTIETAASIKQIQSNVQTTQGTMEEQKAGLDETAAVVEQMARNIESLGMSIKSQASAVSESSAAIEQMISNFSSVSSMTNNTQGFVGELRQYAEEGQSHLAGMTEMISKVSESSDHLNEATALISNIASQTNLLAMNAAIEAAHAGESGKGFAVVADEIRKLAESSATQTRVIRNNIHEVKELISQVDDTSIQTTSAFGKIEQSVGEVFGLVSQINSAMVEQNAGGSQILEALSSMRDISISVEEGSIEMNVGNKRLLDVLTNLQTLTETVNNLMTETTSGINEITGAVNHISELGVTNKDAASNIIKDIDIFKV